MSQGKVIKIDPELLTFSDNKNKTKKKEKKPINGNLKIKTKPQKKRDTLRKQSLLKMIRHHQEDKYKQLFEKKTNKHLEKIISENKDNFKDSFESSKEYLSSLMDEKTNIDNLNRKNNTTLKNNISSYSNVSSPLTTTNNNLPLKIETNVSNVPITLDLSNMGSKIESKNENSIKPLNNEYEKVNMPASPVYGCLKNGNLPTYRSLFNTTRKNNYPDIQGPDNQNTIVNHKRNEILNKLNKKTNYGDIYRKNKQKRTIRRTFNTGKSMKIPKVSVLVTNKTIRNNTTLRIMKIKEKPINEIKRELVKRGLIKVGTITPNDVLRQMYETVEMICGDVQNHNSKNLLYNFINDN